MFPKNSLSDYGFTIAPDLLIILVIIFAASLSLVLAYIIIGKRRGNIKVVSTVVISVIMIAIVGLTTFGAVKSSQQQLAYKDTVKTIQDEGVNVLVESPQTQPWLRGNIDKQPTSYFIGESDGLLTQCAITVDIKRYDVDCLIPGTKIYVPINKLDAKTAE